MHRIDTDNREQDKFDTGKDGFTDGDASTGVIATEIDEDFLDSVQEEIIGPIESEGVALDKTDRAQFLAAIMGASIESNWFASGATVTYNPNCAAYDADHDTWIVGESTGRVLRSLTGGLGWVESNPAAIGSSHVYGVAYNSNMWVAVGSGGGIWTSSDSTTWAAEVAGSSYSGNFRAVTWADDLGWWVAVGDTGEIQTASDPTGTWTRQNTGGNDLNAVSHNETSMTVAVGDSGEILSSPNGQTWTGRTPAGAFSGNFYGAYFGRGQFVISGASDEIQTSANGIDWTAATIANGLTADLFDVAMSDRGVWLAVSQGDQAYVSLDNAANWRAIHPAGDAVGEEVYFCVFGGGVWNMGADAPQMLFSLRR